MTSDDLKLTKDSTYHVRSLGTRQELIESRGRFKGFVSVGSTDGMVVELDGSHGDLEGTRRVIPTHMLLTVDVLEAVEEEAEAEDAHIHYS